MSATNVIGAQCARICLRRRAIAFAIIFTFTGCSFNAPPALPGGSSVIADRLWFGQSIPGGGELSQEQWQNFIDEVVTPRFPDGLTVWRGDGQWRDPRGQIVHEKVIVLEVVHRANAVTDTVITAIAREYVRRFKQDAVLHVRGTVSMQLIH